MRNNFREESDDEGKEHAKCSQLQEQPMIPLPQPVKEKSTGNIAYTMTEEDFIQKTSRWTSTLWRYNVFPSFIHLTYLD